MDPSTAKLPPNLVSLALYTFRVCYHLRIIEGEAPIAAWIYNWYSHNQVTSRKIECSGRVQNIDVGIDHSRCRGIGKFRTGCERIDPFSYEQCFCQLCPCKERVAILANSVVKDMNSGPRDIPQARRWSLQSNSLQCHENLS